MKFAILAFIKKYLSYERLMAVALFVTGQLAVFGVAVDAGLVEKIVGAVSSILALAIFAYARTEQKKRES